LHSLRSLGAVVPLRAETGIEAAWKVMQYVLFDFVIPSELFCQPDRKK
jgi:hypothetical protein